MDQQLKNVALATLYLSVAGFFLVLLLTIKEGAEVINVRETRENYYEVTLTLSPDAFQIVEGGALVPASDGGNKIIVLKPSKVV